MNIFLKKLQKKQETLSPLEQQVLEYIIKHPEEITQSRIHEIAEKIYVSTATISRTSQALGYSGFQEMKYALIRHLEDEQRPVYHPSKNLTQLAERIQRELTQTLQLIQQEALETGAKLLAESQRIEFFGVGSSFSCCFEAARKLTFAGRIADAREDWDELRIVANHLTAKDAAILVSYSGETMLALEYAAILKERKVPIIAIIGSKNTPLEKFASIVFHVEVVNGYYGEIDMSSRIPMHLVLELLILHYIESYVEQ
ncbi:MurR/RpiR family transcriptional regulator [Enterococcus termitis]|uniref:DNA-binding protein n=1 Tax=Enterococcus termitis TaxID=332950 RepID=A0A1E5GVF7_9ENTE|nr:MurR/RpiR family transcriptional regulator [Enterococcus termitis]OEG16617.1 DNA-binding protein [Enterococcus termitis]OJG99301.1 helix-turn-helix domain, rpiR family protein [Enterococcus termitis]